MPDQTPIQQHEPVATRSNAEPAATTGDESPAASRPPPATAERYELCDEIARGGMGVVYRATDTTLGREVAVKVLQEKFGPASGAARRFADEARITGQLQHPGIPPVHDLGTLQDGRPFLAMKLIKGQTLDSLLKDRPSLGHDRGRFVAAFEQICQAVAYAHSKHVIHRDLKPANVMVGNFGEVQVMDWGLAKVLTDQRGQPTGGDPDETSGGTHVGGLRDSDDGFTQAGSVLGTPAFMPPEQAIGAVDRIDASSDVFGLGGVLCAALTGKPPFDGGTAESTRQLAATGRVADAFARLDGCGADPGLVALCKRCLSPQQEDRPAHAGEVAADVAGLREAADDRARRAELDLVRSEGARAAAELKMNEERRRKRVVMVSAAAVAAVLLAGAGAAAWQAGRATDAETRTADQLGLTVAAEAQVRTERDNALTAEGKARTEAGKARAAEAKAIEREGKEKTARATAEAVVTFMRDVFAQGSAYGQAGKTRAVNPKLTVREAMDYAVKSIGEKFGERPEVEAAVRHTIGLTYLELGVYEEAEPQLVRALALREKVLGPDNPETLATVTNLALLYLNLRRYDEAEGLVERALAGFEKAHGPDHPDTLTAANNLAVLHRTRWRYDEAEVIFRRVLTGRERTSGPDHPETLSSANNLGLLYLTAGRYAEAEPFQKRALAGYERISGLDHPDTLTSVGNLAGLYMTMHRYKDAIPLLERVLQGVSKRRELAGVVPLIRADLGVALIGDGRPTEAEPHLLEGYEGLKTRTAANRSRLRLVVTGLVEVYEKTNQTKQALEWRGKLAILPPEVAPPPRPVIRP